jgi:hypothetical protein
MPRDLSEKIVFKLLALSVSAHGWVAVIVAVPVVAILFAIAWRIAFG